MPPLEPIFHIDIDLHYYGLTKQQVNDLAEGKNNNWKDLFFFGLGIFIPSLTVACDATIWSKTFIVNGLVSVLALLVMIVSGILWRHTHVSVSNLVKRILAQEPISLQSLGSASSVPNANITPETQNGAEQT